MSATAAGTSGTCSCSGGSASSSGAAGCSTNKPVARSGKGGVQKVINVELTSGRWPSCPIRRVNHM